MKKVSTAATKQTNNFGEQRVTIGLDLGDRLSRYCMGLQDFSPRFGSESGSKSLPEFADNSRLGYPLESSGIPLKLRVERAASFNLERLVITRCAEDQVAFLIVRIWL